jgi:F-type H+-transporting ATPase subunit delta
MADVLARYARAFADVIFQSKMDANATLVQLESIAQLMEQSHDLREVLSNPSIQQAQKLAVLDAIAAQLEMARQIRNFLAVLIDHRRIRALSELVPELRAEINERLGIADAEVTSARELAADERRQLEEQIAKTTGCTVRARYQQDASLLGGAIVRVGSTVYDGSVRGQLQRMKEQISAS